MPRSRSSTRKHSSSSSKDHFKYSIGESILSKYTIKGLLGDGTFGRVLLVEDLEGQEKAIKVIKLTDKFYEAGKIEAETLEKLNKADPEGKSFIVKLFDHFEFGEFYCLVFEKLGKSLFEVIKENGYKGLMYLGFKMNQIQEFARQILVSIEFMHGLGLTHTDLKPENVLLKDGELVWDEERVRDISRLFTLRIVR